MRRTGTRLLALGFWGLFGLAAGAYPMAGTCLPLILMACAGLLWWRPRLWLPLLLALLPVLDLAPHTGWFFLEEIDVLLLLAAGFAYWHMSAASEALPRWPWLFQLGLLLLGAALVVGLWRGLQPFPAIDANTFNNYLSPANALRVGKGWIWGLLLLPPLRHAVGGVRAALLPGMMTGLLLVSIAAIGERWQFTGLANFSSDYRISAPFSGMHTGGAALDGYLALSLPLLAAWLLARHAPLRQAAAVTLLPLAWYTALATFSRGLYLALAAALAIMIAFAVQRHAATGRLRRAVVSALTGVVPLALLIWLLDSAFRAGGYRVYILLLCLLMAAALVIRRKLALILAGLVLLGATVPIYHGYYLNVRFSSVQNDWVTRMRHWQNTMSMMPPGAGLFGMGLGSFPAVYYWHNPQRDQPPRYQFIDQDGNRHLRLVAGHYGAGYGELLRILQSVSLQPRQQYLLALDVWNNGPPAFLHLNLCQRQLLYPQNCVVTPLRQIPTYTTWQRYFYPISSGPLGSDGLPLKLEMAVEGKQAVLDIDNISLRTVPGDHELLRNGSFSAANDYWFFSSDRNHLPWHIKNLLLNVYFEMGWLGLSAYGLLLFSTTGVLLRRRDATSLAALAAFQMVGLFDSLLDVPRITLLSMLLLCAAALPVKENPP
ncbi:hypothetical protein [Duganella sp.]|uniref:hypothetical protein n=1 Tax=Duganella sp. TaxID=1904440 RepID=UPI0031E033F3